MTSIALLLVLGIVHLGPDLFAGWFGGMVGAWETVCYGIEAAILWAFIVLRPQLQRRDMAICAYAVFEAMQRPLCRPLLPMDKAAGLKPGEYLCDVATGLPFSYLSPVLLSALLVYVLHDFTKQRTLPGRVG